MKTRRMMYMLLAIGALAASTTVANAQAAADLGDSPGVALSLNATDSRPDLPYTRPTEKTKLENYFFDAYGPYPIAGAAIAAGINQYEGHPPEWGQDAAGYGQRFGSIFAITAVSTTTRYALAKAFHEDTL